MGRDRHAALGMMMVLALSLTGAGAGANAGESDPRAVEIAEAVLERMGGAEAWNATRFVRWRFFGRRLHYWDRHTGDIRIEAPERKDSEGNVRPARTVLMNIHTKQGRAWEAGEPVSEAAALDELLQFGHETWVNDSYWMFMPYKLLDPGVTLKFVGQRQMGDGRMASVLQLTFEDVGYTPENKYEVFVAEDTGLVEQWAFFSEASNSEPNFTMPWTGWQQFGDIWLATDHGRERDWEIAVPDHVPQQVFESPDAVP